jgi:type II secretory pathway pseudopilin PulG
MDDVVARVESMRRRTPPLSGLPAPGAGTRPPEHSADAGDGAVTEILSAPVRRPPAALRALALVRTLVAMAIVSVALLGMMAYYLQTFAVAGAREETEAASKAARGVMEQVQTMGYTDLRTAYPPGVPVGFDVEGLKPVPPESRPGSVTVRYPDIAHAEVVIRVRWKGIRGDSSIPDVTRTLTPR